MPRATLKTCQHFQPGKITTNMRRRPEASRSFDQVRRRNAGDVWREAIKPLGARTDSYAVLYALADGLTLGPPGPPWR